MATHSSVRLAACSPVAAACVALALCACTPDEPARPDGGGDVDGGTDGGGARDAGPDAGDASTGTDAGPEEWPPPLVAIPPAPPAPDLSALPRDAAGRPIVFRGARVILVEAPPDPLTAQADCTAAITRCFAPPEVSFDSCVYSAPRCASAEPWDGESGCCAEACWLSYERERLAGVEPIDAFLAAFYGDAPCMPGVAEMLRGEAP